MKSLIKVLVCLALASICAGYVYASNEADYVVVEKPFVETFHSGDTVDAILTHYHNQELDGDFREWKYNILHLPEKTSSKLIKSFSIKVHIWKNPEKPKL